MPTLANIGVPMIGLVVHMWLALLPIVLIEALVYRRALRISVIDAAQGAMLANAVSSVIGLPVTWVVMVVVQMNVGGGSGRPADSLWTAILHSAWLGPTRYGLTSERITLAALSLTLPFFLASCAIEYLIVRRYWSGRLRADVRRACLIGNAITYAAWIAWWGYPVVLRAL